MRLLHLTKMKQRLYCIYYTQNNYMYIVHAMDNIPAHGHAHAEQTTDVLRIPITHIDISTIYINVRCPHACCPLE